MALNGGALNSHAINAASGFTSAIGGNGPVVSFVQLVYALGTSTSDIAQNVGSLGAASTYDIQQEVLLNSTGSGVVVSFKQLVNSLGTSTTDIEQIVEESAATAGFYARNEYEPRVYIGGVRIDNDQLHDTIEIDFSQDSAPQCTLTLIPPTGSQDLRSYRGKSVKVYFRESSGTTIQFTGKVNTPELDLLGQKITLRCSHDIEQYINTNTSRAALNAIGYYNNEVFSKPQTIWEEFQDRLSTVPKSLDFLPDGSYVLTNVDAKSTADYTLGNSDVYRRSVDYAFGNAQNVVNKVNITVTYRYPRLHHHERSFATISPHNTVCDFLTGGYDALTRDLVYQAVNGSAWPLKNDITFSPIYAGGYYKCSGATVGWSTTQVVPTTQLKQIIDSDGNVTGVVTHDGRDVLEATDISTTDYSSSLCKSASWTCSTQFTQNMEEVYTLTVQSSQSQTTNGVKERDDSFELTSDYQDSDWEEYPVHSTSVPSGLSVTGTSGSNFWVDATTNRSTFISSVDILLNRAKSEIIKSHKQDTVTFTRSLWSAVKLKHTVALNASRIATKGKVSSYSHFIDVNSGEAYTTVTLTLGVAEGSSSNSTLALPSITKPTPAYETGVITLSGGYGLDPNAYSKYDELTGHIANKAIAVVSGGTVDFRKTTYPVSFRFDVPSIEGSLRDDAAATASATYNVSLQNDSLTINFTDTNYQV